MIILQFLLALYLGTAIGIAFLLAFAVIRIGGFQNVADRANVMFPQDKVYTSNQVQWILVALVVLWPYYAFTLKI